MIIQDVHTPEEPRQPFTVPEINRPSRPARRGPGQRQL